MIFTHQDEVVYHYTNLSGLLGISDSRKIWATNLNYMNDAQEITYGLELFLGLIGLDIGRSKSNIELQLLKYFKDWLGNIKSRPHHIFAISLTKQGNLLSQWRGYTSLGKGVSIGFHKERLFSLLKRENFEAYEIIYDFKVQTENLQKIYDQIKLDYMEFVAAKAQLDNSNFEKVTLEFLSSYTEQILIELCRLKNPAFAEEQEIRLISKYFKSYIDPAIKFRESKTMLVPYIEFDLAGINDNNRLFREVIVGPAPNFGLAYAAIQNYLSNKDVCNVVSNSLIPYREI